MEAAVVPVDTLAVLDAIRVVDLEVGYVNKKNMTLLVCLYRFTCGRGQTHFPENLGFVI